MRRVNVDRMRRHQRRGRTLRFYHDGEPVEFAVEWQRNGSVVVTPPSPTGIPVEISAEMWDEIMRQRGVIYHPAAT